MKRLLLIAAAAASLFAATAAQAGPFILAGTDADDHGFFNAGNQDGWFFMQRALENIYGGVTTGFNNVTILGSTGSALAAANSAFNNSALVGALWTKSVVPVGGFGAFFGAGGNLGTGILMMDSGPNIGGGVTGTNFNAYGTQIDNFLQAGGGLFSQANGYSWLTTLLGTITVTAQNTGGIGTGLSTTLAGQAAFPGLTNQDLSSGPFHQKFTNTGGLTVLGVNSGKEAVIIGGRTGSITTQVPEPTSLALVGLALAGVAVSIKRKRA